LIFELEVLGSMLLEASFYSCWYDVSFISFDGHKTEISMIENC